MVHSLFEQLGAVFLFSFFFGTLQISGGRASGFVEMALTCHIAADDS
jgi:hypothetical protein